jgi:hypothetical protein
MFVFSLYIVVAAFIAWRRETHESIVNRTNLNKSKLEIA